MLGSDLVVGGITRDPERDGYIIKKTKTKEAEVKFPLWSLQS